MSPLQLIRKKHVIFGTYLTCISMHEARDATLKDGCCFCVLLVLLYELLQSWLQRLVVYRRYQERHTDNTSKLSFHLMSNPWTAAVRDKTYLAACQQQLHLSSPAARFPACHGRPLVCRVRALQGRLQVQTETCSDTLAGE